MKTLRLTLTYAAGSLLLLKCQYVFITYVIDDETFELWDSSNLIFATLQSKNDLLIISYRLCLSNLTFCTVSVIGISVKNHIGASLVLNHAVNNTYSSIASYIYIGCGFIIANYNLYSYVGQLPDQL